MNGKDGFILYEWNTETKEFYFLGHKIDYVNNPSEWLKYLNDLVTENKELKSENQKYKEVIDKAMSKLGRYADELTGNGNAYAVCVDLLDILKEVE